MRPQWPKLPVAGSLNQTEMELLNLTDLPDPIREATIRAMESLKDFNIDTPDGANGLCVTASDVVLDFYDQITNDYESEGVIRSGTSLHSFAEIKGYGIDLTARQFNPHEPFPKLWKIK